MIIYRFLWSVGSWSRIAVPGGGADLELLGAGVERVGAEGLAVDALAGGGCLDRQAVKQEFGEHQKFKFQNTRKSNLFSFENFHFSNTIFHDMLSD